jgi:hypothetical protein
MCQWKTQTISAAYHHQDNSKARTIRRFYIIPQANASLQVETTMHSVPTGGPDLVHSKDTNYSKR